jgi:hypothetical protein
MFRLTTVPFDRWRALHPMGEGQDAIYFAERRQLRFPPVPSADERIVADIAIHECMSPRIQGCVIDVQISNNPTCKPSTK